MIAGTGVNVGGAGMLRTRRRDISIKPNRKLDRKSSRGMIYENEELRLRTIHINAEVEQGQNDIKKLRKENEQLRREIWSLRDEYDKLEELLKKQKCRDEGNDSESRSEENDALRLSDSEIEDEYYNGNRKMSRDNGDNHGDEDNGIENDNVDENEDTENPEIEYVYDDDYKYNVANEGSREDMEEATNVDIDKNQEEQLENAENQKIYSGKLNNNFHRLHVNFDGLTVVKEEEERKKESAKCESIPSDTNKSISYSLSSEQDNSFPNSAYNCFAHYPIIFPAGGDELSVATSYPHFSNYPSTLQLNPPVLDSNNSDFSTNFHNASLEKSGIEWQDNLLPSEMSDEVSHSSTGSTVIANNFLGTHISALNRINIEFVTDKSNIVNNSQNIKLLSTPIVQFDRCAENKMYPSTANLFHQTNQPHIDTVAFNGETTKEMMSASHSRKGETIGRSFAQLPVPQILNNKSKQLFASSLSKPTKRIVKEPSVVTSAAKQEDYSSTTNNEIISNFRMNEDESQLLTKSPPRYQNCNNPVYKSKSFSSENILKMDNQDYLEDSSIDQLTKSFSCQDLKSNLQLNMGSRDSLFHKNVGDINGDSREEYHNNRNNRLDVCTNHSKSFKSQLNVVLKNPQLHSKSCCFSSDQVLKNSNHAFPHEISTVNQNINHNRILPPPFQYTNNQIKKHREYQVTSFESPNPLTLRIPPMTPIDIKAYHRLRTRNQLLANSTLYHNVSSIPVEAVICCPPHEMKMFCDSAVNKLTVHTQTPDRDVSQESCQGKKCMQFKEQSNLKNQSISPLDQGQKKIAKKDKSSSSSEKRSTSPVSQKRKPKLKKQVSVSSCDEPDSSSSVKGISIQGSYLLTEANSEVLDDKNVSRSSSSGLDSPKKEQTRRVSIYFDTKKRPSLTSVKSTRRTNMDNSKRRNIPPKDNLDGNMISLGRERTNSISSRDISAKEPKESISSGSVPWCSCWGSGCF